MPLDDLDDNAAAASTADQTTLDDADAGATNAPEAPATSSVADEPVADTLSIVRDVVEERAADPASSAEGGEEGTNPADPSTQEKVPDDEDFSDVPFHKHPRFQQLLRKSKALEPDATRYRNVQTFLDNNGVTPDEAAEALIISGLAKTDPQACWARLKPFVQNLLVAAGEVLPEDLQSMVKGGQMSTEAALEVSRSRASVQSVRATQSFQEQRTQRTEAQKAADAVYNAAVDWEADRQKKDPNFEAKKGPLQRELAYLQRTEGVPRTPQGVQDQLNRAYKAVPAPVTVQTAVRPRSAPRLPASGSVAGTAQPKAETTLDIIRAAKAKRA